jgi:hypothetical protein
LWSLAGSCHGGFFEQFHLPQGSYLQEKGPLPLSMPAGETHPIAHCLTLVRLKHNHLGTDNIVAIYYALRADFSQIFFASCGMWAPYDNLLELSLSYLCYILYVSISS